MPQDWRLEGGGLLHGAPDESGYLKRHEAKTSKNRYRETGITRWKLGRPLSTGFRRLGAFGQ